MEGQSQSDVLQDKACPSKNKLSFIRRNIDFVEFTLLLQLMAFLFCSTVYSPYFVPHWTGNGRALLYINPLTPLDG